MACHATRNLFPWPLAFYHLWKPTNTACVQDYFSTSVAPVKKVILNYGPTGRSRGSATVFFSRSGAAAEAVRLDGTPVDGKKMRIEVLVDARTVPAPQAPKPLSERVVNKPKNAVKKDGKQAGAAKPKNQAANTNGSAGDKKAKKEKSGRAGRAKAKTAEELDAEMQDYFGSGEGAAASTNGAPAATTNGGDTGMVDEVM